VIAEEFTVIAPKADAYRYPIDTKGNHATEPNQSVNLAAFHGTLDQLMKKLEVIDFGLNVETDRAEMDWEIKNEIEGSWDDEQVT
jgi:hypothetical protein